eukprot:6533222-Heterocapsa_arctica.AAC.1
MNAGALNTIITDGVWYPQRANKRSNNKDGKCLLCTCDKAGLQHIWWECEACNSYSNLNWLQLKAIRNTMNAEPQCLWATGVITKDWTALPETDYMKQSDICQTCSEHAENN